MDDGTFIELYAVKCYWKVHENGDPELRFDVAPTNDGGGEQEEEQSPLPAAVEEHLNGETERQLKPYKIWLILTTTINQHQKMYRRQVKVTLNPSLVLGSIQGSVIVTYRTY